MLLREELRSGFPPELPDISCGSWSHRRCDAMRSPGVHARASDAPLKSPFGFYPEKRVLDLPQELEIALAMWGQFGVRTEIEDPTKSFRRTFPIPFFYQCDPQVHLGLAVSGKDPYSLPKLPNRFLIFPHHIISFSKIVMSFVEFRIQAQSQEKPFDCFIVLPFLKIG